MTNLNHPEILAIMECPICYEALHPPIYVCENGHAVCSDCHTKLDILARDCPTCPLCRAIYQHLPSHILEIIYDRLKVKCKYNGSGCQYLNYGSEVRKHHRGCHYRLKRCPRSDHGCEWVGPLNLVTKHFVENHL